MFGWAKINRGRQCIVLKSHFCSILAHVLLIVFYYIISLYFFSTFFFWILNLGTRVLILDVDTGRFFAFVLLVFGVDGLDIDCIFSGRNSRNVWALFFCAFALWAILWLLNSAQIEGIHALKRLGSLV